MSATASSTTAASSTSPRQLARATSPPTTSLTTTTAASTSTSISISSAIANNGPAPAPPAAAATTTANLQPNLPSPSSERHITEARNAVVASMSNMLDSELQSRASMLHSNAAALEKQQREVERATDGLRREREKLAREADKAARKVKELGNVQNWAEVLERGFLVLEETVRLANGGTDDEESDGSECSCSECGGGSEGGGGGDDAAGNGPMDLDDVAGPQNGYENGKVSQQQDVDVDMVSDTDGARSAWSDASRSLMEPDSSTGTGRAKGSETASVSTASRDHDG